jgi:hypothetical protein
MRARRRRRSARPGEEERPPAVRRGDTAEPDRATGREPLAHAGPALRLGASPLAGEQGALAGPATSGKGAPHHEEVMGRSSMRLEGRTEADYDGGSFQTNGQRLRPASGCDGCEGECVRVTGTLVATYHVTTTVTLPSADDYPDLTACQRRRVQTAIDTVLAPHEQEHVRAFRRYNGTTRRRFDLTLCRGDFDARIQEMFEAEESARRQAAQQASDALDPFHFDVDLDCEEPPAPEATAPEEQTDAE